MVRHDRARINQAAAQVRSLRANRYSPIEATTVLLNEVPDEGISQKNARVDTRQRKRYEPP
jgi:hypothetical protein